MQIAISPVCLSWSGLDHPVIALGLSVHLGLDVDEGQAGHKALALRVPLLLHDLLHLNIFCYLPRPGRLGSDLT